MSDRDRILRADPAELMADVRTLFRTCHSLELATGLPFGPDGFTLGSAGEVVAAWVYDLELVAGASTAGHDAVTRGMGRTVQIKATSKGPGGGVGWRDLTPAPDFLVVIRADPDAGTFSELFNGPYQPFWEQYIQHRPRSTVNNTRSIRVNALVEHAQAVPPTARLPRLHPFPAF